MASASLAPFRSRSFTAMWSGALVSNVGTWMEAIALGYYVADTTGKASWTALVAVAAFLPSAVLGPVGSAMADRLSRRRVLALGNLASATIAVVIALWIRTGDATAGGLAMMSLFAGGVSAFTFPSFQTTIPSLVPPDQLVAAIGLSSAQWNLGRLLGPVFAAVAINLGGIEAALWCNAVSFLAIVLVVSVVRFPQGERARRPVFGALADGVRFARGSAEMRAMLVLMAATMFLGSPFIAFVPQMATNVLGGDARSTSLLVGAQGVGAVVAAFTLGGVTERMGLRSVMRWSIALLCPTLVLYAFAPSVWLAAVALAFVGLCYGYAFTTFASTAQRAAPDHLRGRVLAVNTFVLGFVYPMGSLAQGALADALPGSAGLRWVTASAATLLGAVLVARK